MKQTKIAVRIFACLLCLLMLVPLMIACKKEEENPNDSGANSSGDSQPIQSPSESDTINDVEELPEVNYNGKEFKMLLRKNDDMTKDMFVEDMNATGLSVVDIAVYQRNKTIEKKYGVTIKADQSSSGNDDTDHLKSIQTGETAYHLIANHGRSMFVYAINDSLINWNKLTYVDLDKIYWNQGMRDDFNINGVLYCMAGDLSWHSMGAAVCMVFNKELCAELNMDYPYSAVEEGEWTFEMFKTMALKAKDGSGTKVDPINNSADSKAMLGYMTTMYRGPLTVLYTGGGSVVTLNEDKTALELTLNTSRNQQLYEDFFALMNETNIQIYNTSCSENHYKVFATGNVLFFDTRLYDIAKIRNYGMEDGYGILPWPKYDTEVGDGEENVYYSWSDAVGNTFGVPTGWKSEDYEFISVVLEALCAEGYRTVKPKYYENTLQKQYSDAASAKMIDYILDGRRYDIAVYMMTGSTYGNIGDCGLKLLQSETHQLSTWWAGVESQAKKGLETVNAKFQSLGSLDSLK